MSGPTAYEIIALGCWWAWHVAGRLVGLHSPSPWSGSPSRCRSSKPARRSGGTGPNPSGCGPSTCPPTFSAHGSCGEKEVGGGHATCERAATNLPNTVFFVLCYDICELAFRVLGWKEKKMKHLRVFLLPRVRARRPKPSLKGLDLRGLNADVSRHRVPLVSVSCYQSAGEKSAL